jgi:hypothetical protein
MKSAGAVKTGSIQVLPQLHTTEERKEKASSDL